MIVFGNSSFEYFDDEGLIGNFCFLVGLGLGVFFVTERVVKGVGWGKRRKRVG